MRHRRSFRASVVLILLAISSLSAEGQSPVAEGQSPVAGVDATVLDMGSDSLAVFLILGSDTMRTGTIRNELRLLEMEGRQVLKRTFNWTDRTPLSQVDTTTDVYPSLVPIEHRKHSTEGGHVLSFEDDLVRGYLLDKGDTLRFQSPLDEAVYGPGSVDLVLRSAPLSETWEAEIPTFIADDRRVAYLAARVVGTERIRDEECWRIDAWILNSEATYWVSRRNRRLCQQVIHVRSDLQVMFQALPSAEPGISRVAFLRR